MQIKQAAAQCGLTEKAIRLYEEKGLIAPTLTEKNGRNFRDYDEQTVARLQTIAALRKSFFSLDQIAAILDTPENIPAVFASYRAELHKQYTDLKPLIIRAEEIEAETLSDITAVSNAMTAPAPHGISDEALPTVHFRVWDESTSFDERERAYARYQKWIARWEKRYAVELAVRNTVNRTWKWVVFAVLPLALLFWYFYTQPVVSDVNVTLGGYELVYAEDFIFRSHESLAEFVDTYDDYNSFDNFRDTVIDTLPVPTEAIPRTLTLNGKRYRYLLNPNRPDVFEGTFRVDGFIIDTGDLNGIYSGGTLTPAEAENAFGNSFRIVEFDGNISGSAIQIGNRITIRYIRPEDGYELDSFYQYDATDEHGKAVILHGGYGDNNTYFVFPATNEADADCLFRQTIWTAFQKSHWDSYIAFYREEK